MVVHQDDLVKQVSRRPVQHAVHRPEQGRERLVEETDHDAGRRKSLRIRLVPTPADSSESVVSYWALIGSQRLKALPPVVLRWAEGTVRRVRGSGRR